MSPARRLLVLGPLALVTALPGVMLLVQAASDRAPAWTTPAAVTGLIGVAALLVGAGACGSNAGRRDSRTDVFVVAAFALLVPLAAETQAQAVRGAGALAAACLAAILLERSTSLARFWVAPAAAVACGLDATALILPAAALATLPAADRRQKILRVLLAAGGLIGVAAAWLAGWSMVPARSAHQAYAAHRDLAVLLPMVTVALAGWLDGAAGREGVLARTGDRGFRQVWGAVSLVMAGLIAAGLDAGVSMACLGFWWHVPRGLERLRCLADATGDENASARRLAWLCAAVVLLALLPALEHWRDGLLMTFFVLAG